MSITLGVTIGGQTGIPHELAGSLYCILLIYLSRQTANCKLVNTFHLDNRFPGAVFYESPMSAGRNNPINLKRSIPGSPLASAF